MVGTACQQLDKANDISVHACPKKNKNKNFDKLI